MTIAERFSLSSWLIRWEERGRDVPPAAPLRLPIGSDAGTLGDNGNLVRFRDEWHRFDEGRHITQPVAA